jgi:hypothetical protein
MWLAVMFRQRNTGTTNDGNTARRFFMKYRVCGEITGLTYTAFCPDFKIVIQWSSARSAKLASVNCTARNFRRQRQSFPLVGILRKLLITWEMFLASVPAKTFSGHGLRSIWLSWDMVWLTTMCRELKLPTGGMSNLSVPAGGAGLNW